MIFIIIGALWDQLDILIYPILVFIIMGTIFTMINELLFPPPGKGWND